MIKTLERESVCVRVGARERERERDRQRERTRGFIRKQWSRRDPRVQRCRRRALKQLHPMREQKWLNVLRQRQNRTFRPAKAV